MLVNIKQLSPLSFRLKVQPHEVKLNPSLDLVIEFPVQRLEGIDLFLVQAVALDQENNAECFLDLETDVVG